MAAHYLRVLVVTKQSIHQEVFRVPEAPVGGFAKGR